MRLKRSPSLLRRFRYGPHKMWKRFSHPMMCSTSNLSRDNCLFCCFCLCERLLFGFFVGGERVAMKLLQTGIAAVSQTQGVSVHRQGALLEQSKVMSAACTKAGRDNALIGFLDDDLSFAGVALFLSAVVAPLFFWGRWIGISVASTTMISKANSGSCKAFLPGKLHCPQATNAASTWRIVRQTVGSDTP